MVSEEYFAKAKAAAKPEIYGEDYMSKRLHKDFGEGGFGASYQWDAVFSDGDLYKSDGQVSASTCHRKLIRWWSTTPRLTSGSLGPRLRPRDRQAIVQVNKFCI